MATATITASSGGGYIESRNAAYATARSGSNLDASNVNGQFVRAGQTLTAEPFYYCWEAFFAWDLSSVPAGSVVNSAVLALCPNSGDNSDQDFTLRARDFSWTSGGMTTADYIAGASLSTTGSLRAHYDTSSGWTPNGTYKSFTDDAMVALVTANLGGTLQLVIYSSREEGNNAPASLVGEYVYFGGIGDPNPPRLTIDYTPPASSHHSDPFGMSGFFGT